MKGLTKWVKNTFAKVLDPEREERVAKLAGMMRHGLKAKRQEFSLQSALRRVPFEFKDSDVVLAKERVYRVILSKIWDDGELTEQEKKYTEWVPRCLEMPRSDARAMDLRMARDRFAAAFAEAMEDRRLDSVEEGKLTRIADSVGYTLQKFARDFFQDEGESFLLGMFLAAIDDGRMSQSEWDGLLTTSQMLGISRDELLRAIAPQAEHFVEHVLAESKADGRISDREETMLLGLLKTLGIRNDFQRYVLAEIAELRLLQDIDAGRLPSLGSPPNVETRAGEIVHFHAPAIWRNVRVLRSGPVADEHDGTITLTDGRLIFSSFTKSDSLNYRKIVSHCGGRKQFDVQVEGKPVRAYILYDASPIGYAIFRAAVAMANQTKVAGIDGLPTRHIPRDVRQRVWQRYGGRCAECQAADYLEFDHIIPFAKGGGNTDANVQLLCRRCNLKKSDNI